MDCFSEENEIIERSGRGSAGDCLAAGEEKSEPQHCRALSAKALPEGTPRVPKVREVSPPACVRGRGVALRRNPFGSCRIPPRSAPGASRPKALRAEVAAPRSAPGQRAPTRGGSGPRHSRLWEGPAPTEWRGGQVRERWDPGPRRARPWAASRVLQNRAPLASLSVNSEVTPAPRPPPLREGAWSGEARGTRGAVPVSPAAGRGRGTGTDGAGRAGPRAASLASPWGGHGPGTREPPAQGSKSRAARAPSARARSIPRPGPGPALGSRLGPP